MYQFIRKTTHQHQLASGLEKDLEYCYAGHCQCNAWYRHGALFMGGEQR